MIKLEPLAVRSTTCGQAQSLVFQIRAHSLLKDLIVIASFNGSTISSRVCELLKGAS